jgi:hypothetical protein
VAMASSRRKVVSQQKSLNLLFPANLGDCRPDHRAKQGRRGLSDCGFSPISARLSGMPVVRCSESGFVAQYRRAWRERGNRS